MMDSAAHRDPRFIVVVGTDGSGKSTLLTNVEPHLAAVASWQDLANHEVASMLVPDGPTRIKNRLPDLSRAMFIGGHIVAQYEYLVYPALGAGHDVILDSYYFKLLAKERLFGRVHPAFEELCRELPKPDLVIYVTVSASEAWRRKDGQISPYEHFGEPNKAGFLRFQVQLADDIRHQISDLPNVEIDGHGDQSDVADALLVALREQPVSSIGTKK